MEIQIKEVYLALSLAAVEAVVQLLQTVISNYTMMAQMPSILLLKNRQDRGTYIDDEMSVFCPVPLHTEYCVEINMDS